jgi:hypothetical protein
MREVFLIREKLYSFGKGQWITRIKSLQNACETTRESVVQALNMLQQGDYITVQNLPYKWLLITIIAMPECMAQPRETFLFASMIEGTEAIQ